jgi:hypothetical protein
MCTLAKVILRLRIRQAERVFDSNSIGIIIRGLKGAKSDSPDFLTFLGLSKMYARRQSSQGQSSCGTL